MLLAASSFSSRFVRDISPGLRLGIRSVSSNYAFKGTLRTLREFPAMMSAQGPLTRR